MRLASEPASSLASSWRLLRFGFCAALLAGCAAAPSPLSYDALVTVATTPANQSPVAVVDPAAIQRAFLATPEFDRRLRDLTLLERQALASLDRPLRLGAVGSAILDLHYASLVGHQALAAFYAHVELPEQAALHERWAAAIVDHVERSGSGEEDSPYQAFSPNEAQAYLVARDLEAVGSTYYETDSHPFLLWYMARLAKGPVRNVFFDLDALYVAVAAAVREDPATLMPVRAPDATCATLDICGKFNRWSYIHLLSLRDDDSAAQTFVGWKVARLNEEGAVPRVDNAMLWLSRAARAGNGFAHLSLANLFLRQAVDAPRERHQMWLARAEAELKRGVELGVDAAMVHLARLYLGGAYGAGKVAEGGDLLRRAAALDSPQALLDLAVRHAYGDEEWEDPALAERYFRRAAEHQTEAKVSYARFLVVADREFNDTAWRWLRELADADNADAMVIIGHLYAKGQHVDKRLRRARGWLKNAVKAAPDDAQVVNEVAWTLTVTPQDGLRDARYALKIMDRIMADERNDARRVPAYLDTWAAAFAANGDFERAISVQKQAIALAMEDDDGAPELTVLRQHLDVFRAGQLISEEVP